MPATNTRPRLGRVAFTVDRRTLVKALAYVNDIPDMHPHPYVHWVGLTAAPEHVGVARNNGDVQYHAELVGAQCVTPGTAVVTARELAAAVSSLPATRDPVAVTVDGGRAFVAAGQVRVDLAVQDVQEFADRMPDVPDVSTQAMVGLSSLAVAVEAVAAAAGDADPKLPLLEHVYVELPRRGNGWMRLLSTDRFYAAHRDVEVVSQSDGGIATTVPAVGLAAAVRRFGREQERIVTLDHAKDAGRLILACGPYRAVLGTGLRTLRYPAKKLAGMFTDARRQSAAVVDLDVAAVVDVVQRAVAIAKTAAKRVRVELSDPLPVGLTFADGRLHATVRDGRVTADAHVGCDYTGAVYQVALQTDRLLAGVKSLGTPRVRWHLHGSGRGWNTRSQLWEPLGDGGEVIPGAEHLAMPVLVKPDHGLYALVGRVEVQEGAGAGPAPVKSKEKVVEVTQADGNSGEAFNPWAEPTQEGDVDVADLEATAQQRMQAGDLAGALETVRQLCDVQGADTVLVDENGSQFTWGQVRAWLETEVATSGQPDDADVELDGDAVETPAPEPVKAPAKVARRSPVKAAKAAAKRPTRRAVRQPVLALEPEVVDTPRPNVFDGVDLGVTPTLERIVAKQQPKQPAVPQAEVADLVVRLVTTLTREGHPPHVVQSSVAATMAALGVDAANMPQPVTPVSARPARAAVRTVATVSAARPARKAAVEGVVDGDGLRYALPRGTRVKATAKELRSALGQLAREHGDGIAFHVEIVRGDEDNPGNALVVTAACDGGVHAVADLVDEIAAEVIGGMVAALVAA